MGNRGAKAQGLEKAPMTVEDCTDGVIKLINAASKVTTGRFLDLDGGEIPW
jgi:norsolorinic acid ketoreductase